MTISASNLYIIVTYMSYSGISGDTSNLYTDRKEAEAAAEESSKMVFCGTSLKYFVMDLDDYISEARDEGRRDERDAY